MAVSNEMSKKKIKSEQAAGEALKKVSVLLVKQLDLFDTALHLYSMNCLTDIEVETLVNSSKSPLERKQYLVTTVLPNKGHYKGMKFLMQALKETEQSEILNLLEKEYNEAVDAIVTWIKTTTASDYSNVIASVLFDDHNLACKDGGGDSRTCGNLGTPNESDRSSSADEDDVISLDSLVEQLPQAPSDVGPPIDPPEQQESQSRSPYSYDVTIRLPHNGGTITVTASSPHRPRADDISYSSNPRKIKPQKQHSLSTVAGSNDNSNNEYAGALKRSTSSLPSVHHSTDGLQSVHQLNSDYLVMKFVVVGDTSTGKTSLLERYINKKFSTAFVQTLGVDVMSTELTCYNTKCKLHLWDTAGQERFGAITNTFYRDAMGGFVVYDVMKKNVPLEHCLQWKKKIDDVVQLPNGDPIPIVLIGNKIDCGRLVDGKQFSKENGFTGYYETSAKTGAGVEEAIHFLVKKVLELSYAHQEPVAQTLRGKNRSMSIKLPFNQNDNKNDSSKKKCCLQQQ